MNEPKTLAGDQFLHALAAAATRAGRSSISADVAVVIVDSAGSEALGTNGIGELILPVTRLVYRVDEHRLELHTSGRVETFTGPPPVLRPPLDPDAADGGIPHPDHGE